MESRDRQHAALCFQSAFPETAALYRSARRQLRAFADPAAAMADTERERLVDTGIAGTAINYAFSFEVARWLARRCPGDVSIDWEAIDDTSRLDDLLQHLLQPAEDEYFDSGYVSSREWIDQARRGNGGTDFDWLMAQLQDKRLRRIWTQLYDAADIPLVWELGDSRFSKSRNALPARRVRARELGMRRRPRFPKQAIREPLDTRLLTSREGSRLIDVAMASLAVRHRETNHFNYANPSEIYLADVGKGVSIAVFGLLPAYRYTLECTMGFLILSNGMPVGYGGSSMVFRQVNTGVNIFDEYRGSEAAFLWTQVMRVYHALTGCTRYIANPYQFGGDNDEALESGAFWFYYRLGYRPVSAEIRRLAREEAARIGKDRSYRSNIATLRRLASCDMHLELPGARASEYFDEEWLVTSSMLASTHLGAAGHTSRKAAAKDVARRVARDLRIRNLADWSPDERSAFVSIAAIVAAAAPAEWSTREKATMRALLHAKGGDREARYAMLLCQHAKFLKSLKKACRRADSE